MMLAALIMDPHENEKCLRNERNQSLRLRWCYFVQPAAAGTPPPPTAPSNNQDMFDLGRSFRLRETLFPKETLAKRRFLNSLSPFRFQNSSSGLSKFWNTVTCNNRYLFFFFFRKYWWAKCREPPPRLQHEHVGEHSSVNVAPSAEIIMTWHFSRRVLLSPTKLLVFLYVISLASYRKLKFTKRHK